MSRSLANPPASTNFQALLTDLGITRNNIPFDLRSEVTPVVLVGGTVSFLASPTPAYRVVDVFTAGEQTAPVIGFVMADTGPLPIGAYAVQIVVMAGDRNEYAFEWRNAGNSANLASQLLASTVETRMVQFQARFDVQNDNERFRVIMDQAGTAAMVYQVTLYVRI